MTIWRIQSKMNAYPTVIVASQQMCSGVIIYWKRQDRYQLGFIPIRHTLRMLQQHEKKTIKSEFFNSKSKNVLQRKRRPNSNISYGIFQKHLSAPTNNQRKSNGRAEFVWFFEYDTTKAKKRINSNPCGTPIDDVFLHPAWIRTALRNISEKAAKNAELCFQFEVKRFERYGFEKTCRCYETCRLHKHVVEKIQPHNIVVSRITIWFNDKTLVWTIVAF